MKKGIAIILAALMILSLFSGCGQKTSDAAATTATTAATTKAAAAGTATTAGSAEPVTIEFWNSAEGAMATSLEYLVNQFNTTVGAQKGITVNSTFQGGDVVEKLKTLAQAGDYKNFPDVGQIYSAGLSAVLTMPPLLKMDDLYSSGKYEISVAKDKILPIFVRSYTYENQWIGMPLNASTILMYYNLDAAKEAGLDTTKLPQTIDELAKWTKAMTKTNADGTIARYGFNLQIDRYELVNFLMGISSGNCNYIGDNEGGRAARMTKLTIGEDGSMSKFLTEWEKVIATGGYKAVNDDERGEFANGLSAINSQSSAQLQTMIKNTSGKFELGVGPFPRCTESDKKGVSVGGGSLCMFDTGDEAKKAAAFEFVQFMASAESQLYLFTNNGYLPVNQDSYKLPEYSAFIKQQPLAQVAVDQLNVSDPGMQEPFDLINSELNSLSKENMIAFANGQISKEACESNIVDGFNEKLTEYLRANG